MFGLSARAAQHYMVLARRCNARRLSSGVPGLLEVQQEGGVRTITLADAKTRNSLSLEMLAGLRAAVTEECPALRCVVIRAAGPVFSAGHNLKQILSGDRSEHTEVFSSCASLMLSLQQLPVPVVAQVDGVAAAAGCQLVAACDIVIATEHSTFSTPGGSVGIFCSTPGIPLVRCVPRKVSAAMLLTGRAITAQQALQAGLVSIVVPKQQLEQEVASVVAAIVSKSCAVLALGKRFMYAQMQMTEEEAYREGTCVMVNNVNMVDGQEGIKSFVEKRKPVWTHKFD
uniref:Enoyl-CoA hydratase domain-containing protein 3, mitochondrial n=1 Tax=Hirondellea gigas TaxID=1518452 RepID=A0A2P2I6R6_9CRUS